MHRVQPCDTYKPTRVENQISRKPKESKDFAAFINRGGRSSSFYSCDSREETQRTRSNSAAERGSPRPRWSKTHNPANRQDESKKGRDNGVVKHERNMMNAGNDAVRSALMSGDAEIVQVPPLTAAATTRGPGIHQQTAPVGGDVVLSTAMMMETSRKPGIVALQSVEAGRTEERGTSGTVTTGSVGTVDDAFQTSSGEESLDAFRDHLEPAKAPSTTVGSTTVSTEAQREAEGIQMEHPNEHPKSNSGRISDISSSLRDGMDTMNNGMNDGMDGRMHQSPSERASHMPPSMPPPSYAANHPLKHLAEQRWQEHPPHMPMRRRSNLHAYEAPPPALSPTAMVSHRHSAAVVRPTRSMDSGDSSQDRSADGSGTRHVHHDNHHGPQHVSSPQGSLRMMPASSIPPPPPPLPTQSPVFRPPIRDYSSPSEKSLVDQVEGAFQTHRRRPFQKRPPLNESPNSVTNSMTNETDALGYEVHEPTPKQDTFNDSMRLPLDATSATNNSNSSNSSDKPDEQTRMLQCSKSVMFAVLFIVAATTAGIVYWISSKDQNDNYEQRFHDIANTVRTISDLNARSTKQVYEAMNRQITTYTNAANITDWPFVHLPAYESQVEEIMGFTTTDSITFSNFVTEDQLDQYQQWVLEDQDWITESLVYRQYNDLSTVYESTEDRPRTIHDKKAAIEIIPYVYNIDQETGRVFPAIPTDGMYAPVTQIAPIEATASLINFNGYSHPMTAKLIHEIKGSADPVLSRTLFIDLQRLVEIDDGVPISYFTLGVRKNVAIAGSFGVQRPGNGTAAADDITSSSRFHNYYDPNNSEVVGAIIGALSWDGMFRDMITDESDEIFVVVKNPCNNDFTYRIEGPEAIYMGQRDLHHRSVDDISLSWTFAALNNEDGCPFTFIVYPSEELHDKFHTSRPIVHTVMIIVTFIITTVMFLFYDFFVERRRSDVMKKATRSNAILKSLFPDIVRERLLNDSSVAPQGDSRRNINGNSNQKSTPSQPLQAIRRRFSNDFFNPSASNADCNGGIHDMDSGAIGMAAHTNRPIADLFPNSTVLFADIVGFTAWSSTREPTQVFELLESLYKVFDSISRRLGVYKIETIGDCYVAATGLPVPNAQHAVVMARFAKSCMARMSIVMDKLAVTLGPSTRELCLRVGMHSGPVTGGVLRGEKSRFQLFGDTVNTASRMESTGTPRRIQVSQETADELIGAGKADWIVPRQDTINAKGKGELQTYWLNTGRRNKEAQKARPSASTLSVASGTSSADIAMSSTPSKPRTSKPPSEDRFDASGRSRSTMDSSKEDDIRFALPNSSNHSDAHAGVSGKCNRSERDLEIQWIVDNLYSMLQKIAATRSESNPSSPLSAAATSSSTPSKSSSLRPMSMRGMFAMPKNAGSERIANKKMSQSTGLLFPDDSTNTSSKGSARNLAMNLKMGRTIIDEVQEIIPLPNRVANMQADPSSIMLGREVKAEIEEYVRTIASLYRDSNPFHNFSHASHVVQSTVKLLSRIVVGEDAINYRNMTYKKANGDTLHKTTYGIASDPLTQFSCILAALIHDVDHSGVPNAQLIKEQTAIASLYKNQSVAEQNSIDLSWDLMMGPQFEKFRSCIYKTREELDRFRQLLINAVLATDIVDKELGAFRKNRWNKAFSEKEQRRRRRAIGPMISSNSFSSIMSLDDLTMTDQQIEQVKQEKRMEEKNRMATIVIEHLIQASDVCHTMQHWNIYVKWNERLFDELYGAFLNGRAENDPSTRWYEGEIGFFDHYIIPLAHKLKECGVFGVSSDEYLKYAQANRKEWTIRGREAVARYMSKYNAKNSSMAKRLPASLISLDEKKEDMQSLSPKIPVRMLSKRVVQDDFDDMMSDTEAEHADDLLDGHGKAHDGDYDYDYDHDHNGDRIDLRRRGIPMEISASGDRSYDELVRLNDVDSECADFIVKHITIGGSTEFDDDDSVGTIDA